MKKTLRLVGLGTIIITTLTIVLSQDFMDAEAAKRYFEKEERAWEARRERIRNALADNNDVALKEEIFNLSATVIGYAGAPTDALKGLVEANEIPSERVFEILKDVIQVGLPILKEAYNKDIPKRNRTSNDVLSAIMFLEAIPNADTLALLRECALFSVDKGSTLDSNVIDGIREYAVQSYVKIAGVDAIPFLREVIVQEKLIDRSRNWIDWHLGLVSTELKKENQTNDVANITAFLTEMKQAEQSKE